MKRNIVIAFTLLSSLAAGAASAFEPGFYIGGQLGYSKVSSSTAQVYTQYGPDRFETDPSGRSSGFSPRIYAGYQVNPYFGFEMGGALYPTVTYITTNPNVSPPPKIQLSAFDFVGKGIWEFSDTGFNVYVKAGLAYVSAQLSSSLASNNTVDTLGYGQTSKTRSIRPEVGIGAGYNVNPNSMVDLSYTRIFKGSNFPVTTVFALGYTYSFSDPRCGQFLC